MGGGMIWAIEGVPNPTVLRVHVGRRLTDRTIGSCPPAPAPPPFDRVLEIDGVRSVDLHPYRARVNLAPGRFRDPIASQVSATLEAICGPASDLGEEPLPRAFAYPYAGERTVAESPEMARSSRVSVAVSLFDVVGVSEVVVGPGVVLVRLGRMFDWDAMEPGVTAAIAGAQ